MSNSLLSQPYRYLAILDFEATCDEPRTPDPQEIIEFPLVCIDTSAPDCPIVAEFHTYVKPVHHPKLSQFCNKLTGIKQDQVDLAPTFPEVLNEFNVSDIQSIARVMIREGFIFKENAQSKSSSGAFNPTSIIGANMTATASNQANGLSKNIHLVAPDKASPVEKKTKSPKAKAPPPPLPFCGNIVDIGANLYNHSFPEADLHKVLEKARTEAHVVDIMLTGTSLKGSREGIRLCRTFNSMENAASRFPKLTCTVGVHPHDAGKALKNPKIMADLRKLISENRDIVVAVGECGLDFDRNFSTPEDQVILFKQQCDLAFELGLPLFLHERSAFEKSLEILSATLSRYPNRTSISGVIHCFTGESEEVLSSYLDLGLHIGITGWVADLRPGRGAGLAAIVNKIPLDRLLVETDCPYLTPRNIKPLPRVNEPALLPHVVKAVADCYGVSTEEIGKRSTENAAKLFGLGGTGL
ncbi:hypothetical protein HDU67_000895 [Dinochytrium kinnereticum]|nr:hypothetical protein HDU67_000895 [Dinochytrium kinnereticum]